MSEKIVRANADRKSAINIFFIVFPSAFITNIFMRMAASDKISPLMIVTFIFSIFVLLVRLYQVLKFEISEYVISDEIVLDVLEKKVLINLGFGKSEILKVINDVFSKIVEGNSENGIDTDQTKELKSYWLMALDVFEYLIIEAIEKANTFGWGMVQTSKYSYQSQPGKVVGKVSEADWPENLKKYNLIFQEIIKDQKSSKPKIAWLPFFVPFDSKIKYQRLGADGISRKISIENRFGYMDIYLNNGTCGYRAFGKNPETKQIYYAPQVYLNFTSKPVLGWMANSIRSSAWVEYLFAVLKQELVGFWTKDKHA